MSASDIVRIIVGTLLIGLAVYYVIVLAPERRTTHAVARTISPRFAEIYWVMAWVLLIGSGVVVSLAIGNMVGVL